MWPVFASTARWASAAQRQISESPKGLGRIVAATLSPCLLVIGLVTCAGVASAQSPPDEAHAYVTFFGVEVEFTACRSSDAPNCYLEFSIYRNPPGFTQNPIWDNSIGNANQASHTVTDNQNLKVGQSYTYQVCGGGLANSSRSNCITTNTVKLSAPPPPTPTPTPAPKSNSSNANYCPSPTAPPQNLSALSVGSQIHLKWTNPKQPCPAFLTHIEVYRMGSTVIYQPLAKLDKAKNIGTLPDRYTDPGLVPHTLYTYQVCEGDANPFPSNCRSTNAFTGGADPILTATRVNSTTVRLQISVDQDMGLASFLVTREGSDDPCRQGGKLGNGLQGCRTATIGSNGVATNTAQIATVYNWTNGSAGPGWTLSSKSAPYIINIPNDTGVAPGVEYYYQAHVVWGSGQGKLWEQDSAVATVPSIYAIAPAHGGLTGGAKPITGNGAPPAPQPAPALAPVVKPTSPISTSASTMKGGKSPTAAAAPSPATTPTVKPTSPVVMPSSPAKGPAAPTPTPPARPTS
jgi:hypothetical protein